MSRVNSGAFLHIPALVLLGRGPPTPRTIGANVGVGENHQIQQVSKLNKTTCRFCKKNVLHIVLCTRRCIILILPLRDDCIPISGYLLFMSSKYYLVKKQSGNQFFSDVIIIYVIDNTFYNKKVKIFLCLREINSLLY